MITHKEIDLVRKVQQLGKKIFQQTGQSPRHTVVAGILSKSGKIYFGVNCDSVHGTCAEVVAYANAILKNDYQLKTIVSISVRRDGIDGIIEPCGNCRQILFENIPSLNVVLNIENKLQKINIRELLPYAYDNKYRA